MAKAIPTNNKALRAILTVYYNMKARLLWSDPIIPLSIAALIIMVVSSSLFYWWEQSETIGNPLSFGVTTAGFFIALIIFRIQSYSPPLVSLIISPRVFPTASGQDRVGVNVCLAIENQGNAPLKTEALTQLFTCQESNSLLTRNIERTCSQWMPCYEHGSGPIYLDKNQATMIVFGSGDDVLTLATSKKRGVYSKLKMYWDLRKRQKKILEEFRTGLRRTKEELRPGASEIISFFDAYAPLSSDIIPTELPIRTKSPTFYVKFHPRGMFKFFIGGHQLRFDGDKVQTSLNAAYNTAITSVGAVPGGAGLPVERVWPDKSNLENAMRG